MIERPVIANTTPLIKLAGVGLLELLPRLYGSIWIPEIVRTEYQAGPQPSDPDLDALPWLHIVEVTVDVTLNDGLDAGEAAVITLARETNARLVLLDDKAARQIARSLSLPITGTLGILIAAKRAGFLALVAPVVDQMIAQGRHISPYLRSQALREAGEEN